MKRLAITKYCIISMLATLALAPVSPAILAMDGANLQQRWSCPTCGDNVTSADERCLSCDKFTHEFCLDPATLTCESCREGEPAKKRRHDRVEAEKAGDTLSPVEMNMLLALSAPPSEMRERINMPPAQLVSLLSMMLQQMPQNIQNDSDEGAEPDMSDDECCGLCGGGFNPFDPPTLCSAPDCRAHIHQRHADMENASRCAKCMDELDVANKKCPTCDALIGQCPSSACQQCKKPAHSWCLTQNLCNSCQQRAQSPNWLQAINYEEECHLCCESEELGKTTCCGYIMCRTCYERVKRESNKCPQCQKSHDQKR